MGPRSDFDLLRILSHQLETPGLGKAFHYKDLAGVFDEIRKTVPGYDLELPGLLTGGRNRLTSTPSATARLMMCQSN